MTDSPVSAKSRPQQPITRTDELRQLLDRLEAKVGLIGHGLGGDALNILHWLDEVHDLLAALTAKGGDFTAEQVRRRIILAQLERKAARFLKELGGAKALIAARQDVAPDATPQDERWWWAVDQVVAQARAARLRRLLRAAAIAAAVLILAAVIYQAFLAPDPATIAIMGHQRNAVDRALEGDYPGALAEINQALTYAPDDLELLTAQGALYTILGDDHADAIFADVRARSLDEVSFYLTRAQVYLMMQQPERALADAQAAASLDPAEALAAYFMAVAADNLGDVQAAAAYLELTSSLAQQAGNTELEALARVYLSDVLQRSFGPPQGF